MVSIGSINSFYLHKTESIILLIPKNALNDNVIYIFTYVNGKYITSKDF